MAPSLDGKYMGEKMETVKDFIFLGSKITADSDCSHEFKRHLFFWRKARANLDSVFKSRDISFLTKVCIVKAMVFPIVMYGCERWTIKKADCQRIDAFKLWYWRRLFRVPWTARRSKQSILKKNQPWIFVGKDWCWIWSSNIWLPHWKRPQCWERLRAGREWGDRGWDGWMTSSIQWTWVWARSRSWWRTGKLVCCIPWFCKEWGMTEQLNNNNNKK